MSNETEQPIEHPMEQVLDLEQGTTLIPRTEREGTELAIAEEYDNKDQEIEQQFQEIYDSALNAFERQEADNEIIEPKYRARNQEVAVQYLTTALQAAKEKASLKQHKDKQTANKEKGPNTVNNNLVVADRNEVLKALARDAEQEEQDET